MRKTIQRVDHRLRNYATNNLLRWHTIGLQFVIAALFTTGFMQAWTASIHLPLALLYGYFTGKEDANSEVIKSLKYQKYRQRMQREY